MMRNPTSKYQAFPPVNLVDRNWPSHTITQAPIWMSTDLRDGNQALFEPMNAEKKMRMFKTLCDIGFKQIEIAFPSASETEFGFVRGLIEGGHIPADVTIEVLTQAREHLIRRTFEALKGARRAIVHIYNATSKPFRDIVFGMSKPEVLALAVSAGEGATGALDRVCRLSHGELSHELGQCLADARAGANLPTALQGLADRTGLVSLARFVDGMVVAVERGTPLAEVLRAQAQDVREASRRSIMESGGRKEIGMMVPVVFLVLPITVLFAVFPGFALLRLAT